MHLFFPSLFTSALAKQKDGLPRREYWKLHLYLGKLLCWLEQEEQEERLLLGPKAEGLGWLFSIAIMVSKTTSCIFSLQQLRWCMFLTMAFFREERARALAKAVSGEALPYESLDRFRPVNGMILANASAIGMEPNSDQSPVSKVPSICPPVSLIVYQ